MTNGGRRGTYHGAEGEVGLAAIEQDGPREEGVGGEAAGERVETCRSRVVAETDLPNARGKEQDWIERGGERTSLTESFCAA